MCTIQSLVKKIYLYPSNMHQSLFVQTLIISLEITENNGCMCCNLNGKEQGKERGCTIQYIYFKILLPCLFTTYLYNNTTKNTKKDIL